LVPVGRWAIGMGWHGQHRNPEAVGGAASIFNQAHLNGAGENHFSTLGSNDRRLRHARLHL
jgi:hypothetical protein